MNDESKNNSNSSLENAGKTLLVIRHAKSGWDMSTNDFERPLNDRGKKDAPEMAQRLKEKKIKIDAFVASPAKRAKKTAELFCGEYGIKDEEIIFVSKLYHAPSNIFFEVIESLDDLYSTVAVFSHNPGITEFVNLLIPEIKLDNVPTCGIFAVKMLTGKWTDFKKAKKEFLFFDYPKMI